MLHNFITGINYAKLIQMQANQESFAPHAISRKAKLKIENRQVMAKVNTSRLMATKERNKKNKPKVKVLSKKQEKDLLLAVGGGRKHV